MRKVKYTQETYHDKLSQILNDFPKLDEIHPFYADLLNVLYDRDHYKLALGQISMALHMIDNIGKDYLRLLKYGDSMFRTKTLKRAALGRMCTVMRKQAYALAYLEQVRQHMMRLPAIDPSTRTLILCGFPNVGKSSFMNTVTRANVEVQPYEFTTKSLLLGHTDYKLLNFQVIDTPGVLDHPLEERNTIEMQSITALAHLQAAIVYVMDPSEQCKYSLDEQISLFESIKPLFANKPLVVVLNKTDAWSMDSLRADDAANERNRAELVQNMIDQTDPNVSVLTSSTATNEGVDDVKKTACERILSSRVEAKLAGRKTQDSLAARIHVSIPKPRDNKERPTLVPDSVLAGQAPEERRKLQKELMDEHGGAGLYVADLTRDRLLPEEWKRDVMPEFIDGKNFADFVDPEIDAKLQALEAEEDEQLAEAEKAAAMDPIDPVLAARTYAGEYRAGAEPLEMDIMEEPSRKVAAIKRKRAMLPPKEDADQGKRVAIPTDEDAQKMGMKDMKALGAAEKTFRRNRKVIGHEARKGESDRHVFDFKPKHLYSGKSSLGTSDWR